jgi:hypothetical protein
MRENSLSITSASACGADAARARASIAALGISQQRLSTLDSTGRRNGLMKSFSGRFVV